MKKLVDIREGVVGRKKGIIGTIYPTVMEDKKKKRNVCLLISVTSSLTTVGYIGQSLR